MKNKNNLWEKINFIVKLKHNNKKQSNHKQLCKQQCVRDLKVQKLTSKKTKLKIDAPLGPHFPLLKDKCMIVVQNNLSSRGPSTAKEPRVVRNSCH